MCRLNAKFALGQNVPDSFTNLFWLYFRRTLRSGSFYTPVSRDSYAFRRLVVKVKRTIKLIFFFLFIFHRAIVHSNITSQFSTSTMTRTHQSNKPSNMKRIYRNLHTLMRVYYYKNNNTGK